LKSNYKFTEEPLVLALNPIFTSFSSPKPHDQPINILKSIVTSRHVLIHLKNQIKLKNSTIFSYIGEILKCPNHWIFVSMNYLPINFFGYKGKLIAMEIKIAKQTFQGS
jgi:hypothetical protein